jgi:putative endonuclease
MYFTYILFSEKLDKYYVGYSSDVQSRLKKHKQKHKGFSGQANDWRIVYSESFATKSAAYAREREIKAWKSRSRIVDLIKGK